MSDSGGGSGDSGGGSGGGSGGSSSLFSNPSSYLGAGVGAIGLGALAAMGPGSLPTQFTTAEGQAGWENTAGQTAVGQGQSLVNQGEGALAMAQAGELTPEQQAQLKVYSTGLTNQSRQMFASMGRNPDQDTAFLNQTANVDTQVNAMAQQQIQSTIQLGLGQISGGTSLEGAGFGAINAANSALLAAGEAQLKLDTQYSSNLTSAFASIGQMFGAAARIAPVLAA